MKYFSTRNASEVVTSAEAIVKGLASDGGLFVPESIPTVKTEGWSKLSYPELAAEILPYMLEDYDKEFLKKATKEAYGEAFNGKAGFTTKVKDGLYSLELWHGPTCAFKDYALQLMPRLLVEAKRMLGRKQEFSLQHPVTQEKQLWRVTRIWKESISMYSIRTMVPVRFSVYRWPASREIMLVFMQWKVTSMMHRPV